MTEAPDDGRIRAVGRAVRRLRRERAVSLSELARRSGVGKATVSGIENGTRNPTLDTLFALTTALGVPLGDVLEPRGTGPDAVDPDAVDPGGTEVHGAAVTARLCDRWALPGVRAEVYRVEIGETVQRSAPHAPGVRESLTLLAGVARVGAVGEERLARPGTTVDFPGDVDHTYRGIGGIASGYLVMSYPES